MAQEIKAIVYETDGWFMALCNDFPGVTGEGRTREVCIADLTEKIQAIVDQSTEPMQRAAGG
ncbi:MAG: putative RNase H-like HicB family nuclease [Verrucomicrobiales bacterium]|jgi:predicted RNase H-like HicB family nuclease